MGQIEELPDDFQENLDLNKASEKIPPISSDQDVPSVAFPSLLKKNGPSTKQPTAASPTTPTLPPQMSNMRNAKTDEIIAEMNRTPLFMTSLDETDGEGGENIELEAMKAFAYEGTPSEIAANFRERGNEMYREKKWSDARDFYSEGLSALKKRRSKVGSGTEVAEDRGSGASAETQPENQVEEEKKATSLEELLYLNRAAANLSLQNYRQTTLDSIQVLQRNPLNLKAHFRLISAQLALSNLFNANTALSTALGLFPSDPSLLSLQKKVSARAQEVQRLEDARKSRTERKILEARTLASALKARNIKNRTTEHPPDMQDALIHLEPDPVSPTSFVHYPMLILYPLASQSDLVKSMPENSTMADHLEYIVPDLPWDTNGEYRAMGQLRCFMETVSGGVIKIGKKVKMGEVLGGGKVELVDGVVRVLVVPAAKVDGWIEKLKAEKGK